MTKRELLPIRFLGTDWLLVGDRTEGAITTEERLENFEPGSWAYLYPDGKVRQLGQVIGTVEEIEFL